MKNKLMAFLLIALLGLVVAPNSRKAAAQQDHDQNHEQRAHSNRDYDSDDDYSQRDEMNQSHQLVAGAAVEVRGINGTVDIETYNGSTAEIHVVRSARTREDLNYRKVIIEASGNKLVVRGEQNKDGDWDGRNRNVRQRVTMRIPRQVDLNVSGVNGKTAVGEIDGPVKLSGINGKVDVGQAMGYSEISGINGKVTISISQLSERGINVSGVNGSVELSFKDNVNADLEATGINGKVNTDMAEVVIEGKFSRQNFRAKIGAGGTPIKVSGINGSVKITRAGSVG